MDSHAKHPTPLVLVPLLILALVAFWVYNTLDSALRSEALRQRPAIDMTNALLEVPAPKISDDLDRASLITALMRSKEYYQRLVSHGSLSEFHFGEITLTPQAMLESIEALIAGLSQLESSASPAVFLQENFRFFKANAESVLFTGYFQPKLKGSRTKSSRFHYPIYATPQDLVLIELSKFPLTLPDEVKLPAVLRGRIDERSRVLPYYSRSEIDDQAAISENAEVLAWVEDPVDAFFLQIQGSGIIELEDQSSILVNYDQSNGHPYRSIGRALIEKGYLTKENSSMQSIKAVLKSNPQIVNEVFNFNPSYVFFRETKDGPFGNINVKLSPLRSIATDVGLFPKGAPAFIESEKPIIGPDGAIAGWEKFSRLVVNQDTGGAIKGPGRVDLFTGSGQAAELTAGHMRQKGMLWFLVKK